MNIIRMSGGLGNQMFQYALYIAFSEMNIKTKIDTSNFSINRIHNGYELYDVFGIEAPIANKKEIKQYTYYQDTFMNKVRKKLFGVRKSHYIEKSMNFHLEVLKLRNAYIQGYWQNEKYFNNYKEKVLSDFIFKDFIEERHKNLAKLIVSTNSVSIHIRRGDYVTHPLYKDICNINYYKNAIHYIEKIINKDIYYFVFSNDMKWVKDNLTLENAYYIDDNIERDSYRDMQFMSLCKHNIIANSSFSWWGAWLNKNSNKIVIAPSKWLNDENIDTDDIVPHNWIKI